MLLTDTESANPLAFESPLSSNPIQYTDPLQSPALSGSYSSTAHTIAFVDRNIDDAMTVMANLRAE
jgi:hypothetical protein